MNIQIKKLFVIFILLFLNSNISQADFKKIKKKATVTQPEIIFPIKKDKKGCIKDLYITPVLHLYQF